MSFYLWPPQVSFVEIYNDQILDLLKRGNTPGQVTLREYADQQVVVEGAVEQRVISRHQVAYLLEAGNSQRAVAAHM